MSSAFFTKWNPEPCAPALKFYCDQELEDAHDALADVRATVSVLKGQIEMYQDQDYETPEGDILENPVRNDMKSLHQFTNDLKTLDATQKLRYNEKGEVVFNFGKYNGKPVGPVLYQDNQYYQWILKKEFSSQVKQMVQKIPGGP